MRMNVFFMFVIGLAAACGGKGTESSTTEGEDSTGEGSSTITTATTADTTTTTTTDPTGGMTGTSNGTTPGTTTTTEPGTTTEPATTAPDTTTGPDTTGPDTTTESSASTGIVSPCADLGPNECGANDACMAIMGAKINVDKMCYGKSEFIACDDAAGCGEAETVACKMGSTEPWQFPTTCIPDTFEACDAMLAGEMCM